MQNEAWAATDFILRWMPSTRLFTLNDIAKYSHLIRIFYLDLQHLNGPDSYMEDILSMKPHEYRKLRALLRKADLMRYNKHTKEWVLRNPENVYADLLAVRKVKVRVTKGQPVEVNQQMALAV